MNMTGLGTSYNCASGLPRIDNRANQVIEAFGKEGVAQTIAVCSEKGADVYIL